jgi:acetyl esterase/lipase
MGWPSWFAVPSRRGLVRRPSPGVRRYQPSLEPLEVRRPLATLGHAAAVPPPVTHVTLDYAPNLTADVFAPRNLNPATTSLPAIVFFHGRGLSPSFWFPAARSFAKRGMVAVSFQYQLDSTADAGTSVADAQSALGWLRLNSAALGVNPDEVVAAGDSWGGYLALMTALGSTQSGALYPNAPVAPDAVVAFYPVIDGSVFGIPDGLTPQYLGQTQPLPPTLIVQGSNDVLTPRPSANAFCTDEPACRFIPVAGRGHAFLEEPGEYGFGLAAAESFVNGLHWNDPRHSARAAQRP